MIPPPAVLILEDGTRFEGTAYGAEGVTVGEAVFATGMTGYQETLTDPSYAGQIVVQTAPHIGNTGVNDEDPESSRMWVAGYVVRDPARRPSSWRSVRSLEEELCTQGVVGISAIDTRALTRRLREHGSMSAGIFSGRALGSEENMLTQVRNCTPMTGARLAETVSTGQPYTVEPAQVDFRRPEGSSEPLATVAALDMGIKSMTPRRLAERGIRVHVLPANTTFKQLRSLEIDGLFISNGPGDPSTATEQIALVRTALADNMPFFGICFGHQLLGRALGFGTYKLRYGHRGINVPVLNRARGTVEVTSQNHGFAVDAPLEGPVCAPQSQFGRVQVSHVCLNDQVVEGLRCLDVPAFSVQYHPEAAAGPHDSNYLFEDFLALLSPPGAPTSQERKGH